MLTLKQVFWGISAVALLSLLWIPWKYLKTDNGMRSLDSYDLFPDVPKDACLSGTFRNTVLVLNFNFNQFYSNIPVLYDMYDGVFGRLVMCGPKASKFNDRYKPDIVFNVEDGHFSYVCLRLAMEKYPGYEGYIYGQDDMIINWWNLVSLNRKKIWRGVRRVDFSQDAYKQPRKYWIWWRTEMGLTACQRFHMRLAAGAKNISSVFLLKSALTTYLRNGHGYPRCGKGWSDFFYVPASMVEAYKILSAIAYEEKLYLEIAVNNILMSMDSIANIISLDGLYLPDIGVVEPSIEMFWGLYNVRYSSIHPFKINVQKKKQLSLLHENVVRLKESLIKC